MPGPLPKPPGQRRRTNSPAWRILPADGPGVVPSIPSPSPRRRWSAEAREAWRSWWLSPMASVWVESDGVTLPRALRLVDDLAVGRWTDHQALSALEDRLGLSPLARRRVQWEIAQVAPAPVVALPMRVDDPRRR
jgi:hypothetical protein